MHVSLPPGFSAKPSSFRISGFTAACLLVSNVIGIGLFTTTGFLARDLGDPMLILALWGLGALFALMGALSYSELGAAFPVAGGEYIYLREAYGLPIGFLSGWTSLTIGFGASIAVAAVAFGDYAAKILPLQAAPEQFKLGLSLVLIWTFTLIHLLGVRLGGAVQQLLTGLKVGTIGVLIAGGFSFAGGDWHHLSESAPESHSDFGQVVRSFIFVTYAYSGWNIACYLAGEIQSPQHTLPKSMIWGTVFVGAVSLGVNLLYLYVLPVTSLAQEPVLPVAEKVALAIFEDQGAYLVNGLVCISIAGAVSAMVWAGPRVYCAMARDGTLPQFFSLMSKKTGIPFWAIVFQSVWASILVFFLSFEELVIYGGSVLIIFNALTVSAVIVLRGKFPNLVRPYSVPLYPYTPLIFVGVSLLIVIGVLFAQPKEVMWGMATSLLGLPVYFFLTKRQPAHPVGRI